MTRIAATRVGSRPLLIQFPTEPSTDDVDWIAVERVVAIDRPLPELNPTEKRIAALLLAKVGRTEAETGALVGVSERQVSRWKQQDAPAKKRCGLDGCDDHVKALGLCNRHYLQEQRRRKRQSPKPAKTTCRRGHAYPDCLGYRSSGKPYCRPCDRASRRAYRERTSTATRDDMRKAA